MRDSAAVQRYQDKINLLETFLVVEDMLDTNAMQQLLDAGGYTSIRDWMAFLRAEYLDRYDGKLASTLYNGK